MADVFDAATRSRIMKSIRSKGTKPEERLAEALDTLGLKFERNAKLPGSPDVAIVSARLAVFVHGCFWHCCPRHFKMPSTRRDAWTAHFDKNLRRDRRVRRQLRSAGWATLVVWEHECAVSAAQRVARRARALSRSPGAETRSQRKTTASKPCQQNR